MTIFQIGDRVQVISNPTNGIGRIDSNRYGVVCTILDDPNYPEFDVSVVLDGDITPVYFHHDELIGMPIPVVGMGGTRTVGSDRYPFTVVRVISPTRCIIQEDTASRTDRNGLSESQEYTYAPNPAAPEVEISLRKNGRWYRKGDDISWGSAYALGMRRAYHDPSF